MPDEKETTPSQWADVYDVLEQVRIRPGMWVRRGSVQELSTMLFGYCLALQVHSITEPFDLHPALGPFAEWLRESRGWPMALGWAAAIEQNAGDSTPLDLFFSLLDEFRAGPGRR